MSNKDYTNPDYVDARKIWWNASGMKNVITSVALFATFMTSGCITLSSPEKPIEINLNINIRQEVIVKLQKDAQDIISNNPELFPK